MKKSVFWFALIAIAIVTTSLTIIMQQNPGLSFVMAGVDHDLSEGIKISELSTLKGRTKDDVVKIDSMEITLARGNRALGTDKIAGGTYNLSPFKRDARSGDRIVIEVIFVNADDSNEPIPNAIYVVPLN